MMAKLITLICCVTIYINGFMGGYFYYVAKSKKRKDKNKE
jgi:hypothetical protein